MNAAITFSTKQIVERGSIVVLSNIAIENFVADNNSRAVILPSRCASWYFRRSHILTVSLNMHHISKYFKYKKKLEARVFSL